MRSGGEKANETSGMVFSGRIRVVCVSHDGFIRIGGNTLASPAYRRMGDSNSFDHPRWWFRSLQKPKVKMPHKEWIARPEPAESLGVYFGRRDFGRRD